MPNRLLTLDTSRQERPTAIRLGNAYFRINFMGIFETRPCRFDGDCAQPSLMDCCTAACMLDGPLAFQNFRVPLAEAVLTWFSRRLRDLRQRRLRQNDHFGADLQRDRRG